MNRKVVENLRRGIKKKTKELVSKTKKNTSKQISKDLKNKTILVTGGAGSIGSHLVKKLLDYPVKSVRVLDIDESQVSDIERARFDLRIPVFKPSTFIKYKINPHYHNYRIPEYFNKFLREKKDVF